MGVFSKGAENSWWTDSISKQRFIPKGSSIAPVPMVVYVGRRKGVLFGSLCQ